jgi:excisionase family DNA binding protein
VVKNHCDHDWVDIAEVARRLGVQVPTVYMMKQRGTLPPARLTVGGRHPVWDWNLDWVPWLEKRTSTS